jgi:hypothetical protein
MLSMMMAMELFELADNLSSITADSFALSDERQQQ